MKTIAKKKVLAISFGLVQPVLMVYQLVVQWEPVPLGLLISELS